MSLVTENMTRGVALNKAAPLLPLVTRADKGVWIELGNHRGRVCVSSRDSGGAFLFGLMKADYDGGVSAHIHDHEDETFYVTRGQIEIVIEGETIVAEAGDMAFAPRGAVHSWRCISEGGAEFLGWVTPGENFERYLMEIAQQNIARETPAGFERIVEIAKQYGIHMRPGKAI